MQPSSTQKTRSSIGKAVGVAAAAMLCVTALGAAGRADANPAESHAVAHPGVAHAAAGGGLHPAATGASRAAPGGFRGFAAAPDRDRHSAPAAHWRADRDGAYSRGWSDDHRGVYGLGGFGIGVTMLPGFGGYYPYGYDGAPAQTWYYCSDPAGYYPYVTQCQSGWQAVPAG